MNRMMSVILMLIMASCVKDVDFDQAENLNLSPVLETSIVYFNEPANTFFLNELGEEVSEIQDATVIDIFDDDFVIDNLVKAVFTFKINNTVTRRFQTRVDFLNLAEEVQHTFTLNTMASINNESVVTDHIEVFEGNALEALKASNKVVFTVLLPPSTDGSIIDQMTIGRVELKSKATFYLNINTAE